MLGRALNSRLYNALGPVELSRNDEDLSSGVNVPAAVYTTTYHHLHGRG